MFGIAFIVILLLVTRLYQAICHPAVTSTQVTVPKDACKEKYLNLPKFKLYH